MKKMLCIDCKKVSFQAETSEQMMKEMMPHYMKAHPEIMSGKSKETREEWMKRFMKEWSKL